MADATLKLTAWAVDNASGPIGQIATAAKKMPEGFAKASAAMGALGGAAGDLGRPITEATGKLTGLLSVVATGGPLGLGIAALTVAVSAGVTWWHAYTAATRTAEEAGKKIDTIIRQQSGAVANLGNEIEQARKALVGFGMNAEHARIGELQKAMADNIDTVGRYREHIKKLEADIASMGNAEKADIMIKRDAIRMAEAQIDDLTEQTHRSKELIDVLQQTTVKQDQKAEADKRAAKAARDKAQADADAKRIADEWAREETRQITDLSRKAETGLSTLGQMTEAHAIEMDKAVQRDVEFQKKQMDQLKEKASGVGEQFGSVVGGSLVEIAKGTMTAEEGFKAMAEQVAILAVKLAIAAASAAIIESATGGAGAGAGGFIGGIGKSLLGFSKGGLVRGGQEGRDSVPAMLTPGEFVLPVDVTRRLMDGNGGATRFGIAHFANGGMVTPGAGGAGGPVVINAPINLQFPPTRLQKKQMAREVGKTWAKMVQTGQIPPFTRDD